MQSQIVKLNLLFVDRIGVVADISRHLAKRSINIVSMEVERKNDLADVYLAVDPAVPQITGGDLLEALSGLSGLQSIRLIRSMPGEDRQNTFHTVLDNVSDGIISIDAQGRITTINQLARTILNCPASDLIGRRLDAIPGLDTALIDCLAGTSHTRLRKSVTTQTGHFEFYTSARPIVDGNGRIIGAVEIMKDLKAIKALVDEVVQPESISFDDFVGDAPTVRQAIAFARRIASTPAIVSIRGASGTGKELFARAIHTESRRHGPFIPVNCAAIPDTLIESELFGYQSGAFTGAEKRGRAGLFEQAQAGTLFLDEIADLPSGPQAKILRAIQEKKVRRIGGNCEIEVEARIITATNRSLERLVETGAFRQDLYYRINVLPIHLPPLVSRIEDIPLLANHFLFQINSKLESPPQKLSPAALEKLSGHDWPGNVRELKNVIERAAILCDSTTIGAESVLFSFELTPHPATTETATPVSGSELATQLDALERKIVVRALKASKSIRQAATQLGISHTALRNKIKKHHLDK